MGKNIPEYVLCVRNKKTKNGTKVFGNEPGPTLYLKVPADKYPEPSQAILRRKWVTEILKQAEVGIDDLTGKSIGDILVFIHGYNNSQETVLKRHRKLEADLRSVGYRGAVISYDWPSAQSVLNYLEDRDGAKDTARRLRDDGISLFSSQQSAGCKINVHLLGHSTGTYVI